MTTHSSILPRESQGQKSLVGYSPWGCEESDTTELTEPALTTNSDFISAYSVFSWLLTLL